MTTLPPVCAACMGLLNEWVVYDGGLVVCAEYECERYARRRGKVPVGRGHTPPPVINDGKCHYCGKNAWASPTMATYRGRDFCSINCSYDWAEFSRAR